MLFILDKSYEVVGSLNHDGDLSKITTYFDDKYVQDLGTGAETFQFSTMANTKQAQHLIAGNYIAFKEDGEFKLFNIIQIEETHEDVFIKTVYCEMAGIELINEIIRPIKILNSSLRKFLNTILEETEWQLGKMDAGFTQVYDFEVSDYKSAYELIQEYAVGIYGAEISYRVEIEHGRIIGKYIDCYMQRGNENGFRFAYGANLTSVTRTVDMSNLATALIGVGKSGLTFKEVETGDKPLNQDFIANEAAFKQWNVNGSHILGIHKEDTDSPQELLRLTRIALEERANPKIKYEMKVELLGKKVKIGDTVNIIDHEFNPPLYLSARVNQLTTSKTDPNNDEVVLANFKELNSNITEEMRSLASQLEGYVDSQFPISGDKIQDGAIGKQQFSKEYHTELIADAVYASLVETEELIAGKADIGDLTAINAKIENLKVEKADITELHAQKAEIEELVATKADIGQLNATNAQIENLKANKADISDLHATNATIGELQANKADIGELNAVKGEITHLKSEVAEIGVIKGDVADIEHILAGNITADNIQTGAITAGSGIIADGAIGNAQISKIDAGKIEAGTIDTSKVTIQGSNGHLRLKGNRMQVFEGTGNQAKERVSVGDVNGDGSVYGLRVRGADGQTILLDENGVTSEGITDGSITNDKISDDANIDGAKLNINSVVSKINEDGTETIQGTKIEVDGTTLNTKLSTITNKQTEDGERITQAQSQITANTNAIKLKVDEQTYTTDKKDMTSKLEKNTSEISTMKGQIALKVEQTDIENAKSELEGTIDSKINTAKADIKITTDAIKQNVSNLTQTVSNKADGSTVSSLNSKVSSLETSVNGISGKVTSLEKTTTTLGTQVNVANTNASSALNKANSATTTANNAQNTANTNKSNITDLQGEVSTVKSNVASLEVTTSGISQKVSSVESTTATLSGKVNTANTNATNALNKANSANTLADSKAKVFTSTPTVPYKVGDLWTGGPSGDVMRCKTARTSGSYTASDWEKASKYTDDTKANAVDGKVTTLQGEYNTTKSKVATLETNLDGITQRVSSTESTTATLTTKVNTAQSTADAAKTAASNAQNSANNANNALSINQQTKMNGIELFNNEYKSNTSARPFTNGNYSVVVATEISGANANESNIIKVTNGQILYTDFIACNINNPYYASIEVYNKDTNNGTNYIQVCYYDKNKTALESNEAALNAISGVTIPSANAWHKLEGWVNVPASNDVRRKAKYVRIRIINRYSGLAGITYWRNISWKQLGSGLLADTQETKTEIASTKSKVATIETNLSSITSRVGSVETNQTTVNGKVSSLETRMSTAESKITETAITNTVKKNFYTKSETDSQITSKGYQTASQVQQTVNGLEVKVQESGGYNLIKNSTGASQNTRGWTCTSGATLGVGYIDDIGSNNSYVMYLDNGTATSERFAFSSRFKLKPNTKYTFVGYFNNYNTCPSFDVYVLSSTSLADTDTSVIYNNIHHLINSQNTNGSWKKFTATFTTPASTRSGYIRIDNNGYNSAGTSQNRVHWNALLLVEGELELPWSPHPSEVYDGVTTIDKDGITVKQSNISTYTEMDANSFRVSDNNGGTVAEFSKASIIPYLTSGTINASNIYANNMPTKEDYSNIHFIHVNGITGSDTYTGHADYPYKTVQRAIQDISDIQNTNVTIYVSGSVQGFTLRGIAGSGVITFSLQDNAVINGGIWLHGVENRVNITNESSSRKPTLKNGIAIDDCRLVDLYCLTFRGTNGDGTNISINNTNYCAVNSCDLGGLSTNLLCAIRVQASLLWLHGCIGSNITDVVGQYPFSHVMMSRGGTSNVPDYSNTLLCNYDGAGRIQNWTGGTFVKTPSSGWNPAYTPTQKTQVWSFNKIWSDETLHGWSDRQELIQGYASTWNTGRWTGYMQFADGMAAIRSAISGGTNLSGRIYVQRTSSSGNSTGSKLCLYASDGTLITNSTTINRSQGVWVSLSSAIIQKIQSGAITYFYLKADSNNTATYFKCESNPKIEITYTK